MLLTVKTKQDFCNYLDSAGGKLVVVDFYATWCGPCKKIARTIEELANQYSEKALVLKVDVDEVEEVATDYQISSMPQFFFIKDGKILDQFAGASDEKLNEYFAKHMAQGSFDDPSLLLRIQDPSERDNYPARALAQKGLSRKRGTILVKILSP